MKSTIVLFLVSKLIKQQNITHIYIIIYYKYKEIIPNLVPKND